MSADVKQPGRFISIEGGEGVGKSTQIAVLADALRAQNIDVIVTREPGGTEGAEAIRQLLLSGSGDRWEPRAEALLFAAARSDHVARLIRPALAQGRWVISDRFVDSSRAYQGQGTGQGNSEGEAGGNVLTDEDILAVHDLGSGGLLPDRTLVLSLNDKEANSRAADRDGGDSDRIQSRSEGFHAAVHNAFDGFAQSDPDRVRLIDASGAPEQVTQRIWAALEGLL